MYPRNRRHSSLESHSFHSLFWLFLLPLAFRVPLQRVSGAANWERTWRSGEKHRAVWVGSGRPHDWQRPLPIMAAGGNNDGSGRCQPVFTPCPHSLVVDAKKGTVEKTVAFFEDSRRFQRLFSRTARHKTGVSFCFFLSLIRTFAPMKRHIIYIYALAALLLAGCNASRHRDMLAQLDDLKRRMPFSWTIFLPTHILLGIFFAKKFVRFFFLLSLQHHSVTR